MNFRSRLLALAALLVATGALAQSVYRHVDANGKVSFSDQPPAAVSSQTAARGGAAPAAVGIGLPYELRQVSQRYPVTLYTSGECGPCEAGRSLLMTRGVPFSERSVKTNADAEALQRLSSQTSLPLLTIGTQQLKGFSDAEWSQYLDAAGYPKSSKLPANYHNAPAQPLVAQQAVAVGQPAEVAKPAPAAPAPRTDGPTPGNPAGIKF